MEKLVETTLENSVDLIKNEDVCGNTTRLVDHAIQIIFSGKKCIILDHYLNGQFRDANKRLFDLVFERLCREHNLMNNIKSFSINHKELTIQKIR